MKVLIAEDDKFLAKAFKVRLEKEEVEVEVVDNGKQALEKLESFTPNVVLLDLVMPVMDGFDFLGEIKKEDSKFKDIPIVVTTNLGQKEDKKKAMDLGADGYLVKSDNSIEQIVETVGKYKK